MLISQALKEACSRVAPELLDRFDAGLAYVEQEADWTLAAYCRTDNQYVLEEFLRPWELDDEERFAQVQALDIALRAIHKEDQSGKPRRSADKWTSPMRMAYAWAERESRLTHRDVSVLFAMIGNGDANGRDVFVGQPRVAHRLRYNRTTISRALGNLERFGVLEKTRESTQHYTATWKLNPPPIEPWAGSPPWKPQTGSE